EVAMNPILLKPTGERTSQVVVLGEPWEHLTAAEYHRAKPRLLGLVLDALADLRARFDVIVAEGAGSPAEINLLDHDIVNLRIALDAEASLALGGRRPSAGAPARADALDVAVVRLPRISNFTDVDALAIEPGVSVRFVEHAHELGDPDLVVLPGTKATVADLA